MAMITPIRMPKLGETDANTFSIEKWLAREGENVRKGQGLLLVATDKTSIEVEARAGGVLRKIIFKEGETVTTGTVIAVIGTAKAAIPAELCERKLAQAPAAISIPKSISSAQPVLVAGPAEQPQMQVQKFEGTLPPAPVALPREGQPRMSPRARRKARELGVPLQALSLPADGQRITASEVLDAAKAIKKAGATPAARHLAYEKGMDVSQLPPAVHRLRTADLENASAAPPRLPAERVPLKPVRRLIAEKMSYAQQFIPQFSVDMIVRTKPLLAFRRSLQNEWGKREAPSVDDCYVRAVALALADDDSKPFRAIVDRDDLVYRGEINVGFAINLGEHGVSVPVVRRADRLSLRELAAVTKQLSARAKNRSLKPTEHSGALMTVSNLGTAQVSSFRAIVRPGESAILAVPAAQPRPIFTEDWQTYTVEETWQLSLSADHRIVDGVLAATFLSKIKCLVECPERLI